ncbi:MAG: hypothetical protein B6U73_02080 [Desulfurococcales archaeon ex4484_204]|nr:MAG: hypothetical protein B6U73_02080 [Desulfurococcales archaeon ex4484_204]
MVSRLVGVLVTFTALVAGVATYAVIVEPNLLILSTVVEVRVNGLPECFNGFRIAHVTDPHFGIWHLPVRDSRVLEIVKGFKPDIIVITGDLISNPGGVGDALNFVRELARVAPTYVVLGNWDYWSGVSVGSFVEELRASGARVLVNSYEVVGSACGSIYVVGVDDPHTQRDDVSKALEGVPEGAIKVVLAHSPEVIGEVAGKADVVLVGHTHGGQVVIPVLGPIYIPLPEEFRKYVWGSFTVNGTFMYVCRGVGTSLYPVRFMAPPEVALVVLIRA